MEQSKIDIGKIIDTKLSENITITRCDTKVWIKTIFMENMEDLLKQCTETFRNMYLVTKSDGVNGLASHLYVGQRKTMP